MVIFSEGTIAMDEAPLRAYLKKRFYKYEDSLQSNADLAGVVDSMGLFELVEFIEEAYRVKVPMAEFRPARFATIRDILTLIDELKTSASQRGLI
jgi:acyl carrier protein